MNGKRSSSNGRGGGVARTGSLPRRCGFPPSPLTPQRRPQSSLQGCPQSSLQGCPQSSLQGCPQSSLQGCPQSSLQGCPQSSRQRRAQFPPQRRAQFSAQRRAPFPPQRRAPSDCVDETLPLTNVAAAQRCGGPTPRALGRVVSDVKGGTLPADHNELTSSETEMPNDFAILTSVLKRGSRVPRSIF